ncbi:unnamed protein product [Cyprideis torosa]|uniref:Cyanocobalamin reductase (cyanide-eliminating) n=1 Tax=Cyprideis torosa TaxID=163714 RepID=A0A7R8ZMA8_9CRUS|nr:unnamed protein product [Cyprideis torosa]CAG0893763.1 unnamed protein product [Cyprideis torosa]
MDGTKICESFSNLVECFGLETKPFKIGWYNDAVGQPFKLPHDPNTLAILVMSSPRMFKKCFEYFLHYSLNLEERDPLDQSLRLALRSVISNGAFSECEIELIHDFELDARRRPRMLMQTVGHVSGAAFYYRREDIDPPDPWPGKKMFGVAMHPKYGGWFAFRAVAIFRNLKCPDLLRTPPVDVVPERSQRIELLEAFNFRWRNWQYRDLGPEVPEEDKYEEVQRKYFELEPGDKRKVFAQTLLQNGKTQVI